MDKEMWDNVEQIEEKDVLIIRPRKDAPDCVKLLFGVGSICIRPNNIFYPEGDKNIQFETKIGMPWGTIYKCRGLATSTRYEGEYPNSGNKLEIRIYGMRSLQKPRESGYEMEGQVSIKGKSTRAFTSSTLFERPDGSLINVATLYVCVKG